MTRVLSYTHHHSITTATCPHSMLQNPHKMTWHHVMKTYTFPYPACVHRETPLTRFDCPQKKIISAFLYFTLEACPPLYYSFLLSHTSHYSQIHFPISQIYFSLSLKSEKTKNGENSVALCAVCASSFGYRQPTDEQPIQRARARVLWHLPCRFRNLRHHLHSRYLSCFLILCSSFLCVALLMVYIYVTDVVDFNFQVG